MIAVSKRLDGIGEYYFSLKLREIDELNRQGKNIISLGIGSPDLPPHPDVIRVLQEESAKPNVHGYQSYKGSPVLRKAITNWYKKWYEVELNPDTEILPLIGSKEGIVHICMTYLNEGDEALIPNPGYPTYGAAVKLAGGKPVAYQLKESNNWQPDITALNKMELGKVKLMFLNYPHMPTGQLPDRKIMEGLVPWAKEKNILLVHDNPYSFILNEHPVSLLGIPHAKDVVLELNSLSKSSNMAGWRVGMLSGAAERINEVLRFKSNMDSGMFLPIQLAAAKALELNKDWYDSINAVYRARRKRVFELLEMLECSFSPEQVGLFVWAKIPARYKTGYELSDDTLYHANVFITPGGIFGSAGDNYVRVSLCANEGKIDEAIERVKTRLRKQQ